MALLEVNQLTKNYTRRSGWRGHLEHKCVVDHVSFSILKGETLGLVGESGSGKSTVARMILGLIPPTSGTVLFDGEPVTGDSSARQLRMLRRRMQPVFQDPYAALNPRMTVAEIIAEPFRIHRGGTLPVENPRELLRAVGLDESALPRYPHEFSGGQRQRINIARALALRPELLLLDEPVSALDVSVGAQIMNLLRHLQHSFQLTYLFISHSMPLVRYLSTNVIVMQAGKLVEMGPCDQICQAPVAAYTRTLLQSTPELPVSGI